MQYKFIGIIVSLLIVFGSIPLTAQFISSYTQSQVSINQESIQKTSEQITHTLLQNTLIFGCAGDADKLDPGDITDGESMLRIDNIFEGLVSYIPGTADIQPCLATKWDISPDGTVITFYLRQGVKFQDGTDFNADAVVFSFERQFNTTHPYYQYGQWAYWHFLFSDIKHVEKIDTYAVDIHLEKPNAEILKNLAMCTAAIVSPTNVEQWKEDAFKHPVGTGPFKFVEWIMDENITLEAYEGYWQGKPKLDSLIFRVIKDSSARLLALQLNTIQGMEEPDQASFDIIKTDHNLSLLQQVGLNLGYLAINNGYGYYDANQNGVRDLTEPWVKTPGYFEPFTKKEVRQAINYAINKTAIIKNIYGGTAVVAKTGIPPAMLGYNDDIVDYAYDPVKARELLADAGYPDGFTTTLWVMPVDRLYMGDPIKVAEAFQDYLEDVNIHTEIYTTDWATYLQKVQAGEHPMCFLGWISDNGDPNNFMNSLYGANQCQIGSALNVAFYNNTTVQELLSNAFQIYDNTERASLYKQAQDIIHEDAPFVYLAHVKQYIVFRSNVTGFIMNPTGRLFFYPAEFKTIPSEPDGKILFTAWSTGPCGVAWGYQLGPGGNPTPDAYFESGKGMIINFGTMPYHTLYSPLFSNYFLGYNDAKILWNIRGKILIKMDWEHNGVKYQLQATCTPLETTTGTFSYPKSYLITVPPLMSDPENPELNGMAYTGSYRNGSKTESISGFAYFGASAEENDPWFAQPIIAVWLFHIVDGGEIESVLTALWAKNRWDVPGTDMTVEKANTFHVNYWTL